MKHPIERLGWILLIAMMAVSPTILGETGDSLSQDLYVAVHDRGHPVADLTANDFRLFENQHPVWIESATPAGPASVVLLVENSLASWTFLNEVNSAMRGFMKSAPAHHDYALVSYGRETRVEATMTKDSTKIAAAFSERKPSAWSYVGTNDAIARLLDDMEQLNRWKTLIVIGSGNDSFSEESYRDLIRRVERSNVVIHTIQLGGSSTQQRSAAPVVVDPDNATGQLESNGASDPGVDLARGEMLLRAIAERSGGEYFCPSCEAGFRTAIEEILDAIDRTYRVTYRRSDRSEPGLVKYRAEAFRLDDDTRHDYSARVRSARRF